MPPMSTLAAPPAAGTPLRQDATVIGLVGIAHLISHYSQLLLAPLDRIHILVTDDQTPPDFVGAVTARGRGPRCRSRRGRGADAGRGTGLRGNAAGDLQ